MSARRELIGQAMFAICCIAIAVGASRESTAPMMDGNVTLVDCGDATAVELTSPRRDVKVEDIDGVVWISVTLRREEGEPIHRRFQGGQSAVTYLAESSPLVASRSLGVLQGDALHDVGLDELSRTQSATRLTVRCGDEAHAFDVGGSAYGTGDRYVRSTDEGAPVVLVRAARLRDLDTAELHLKQLRLHRFQPQDVATVLLESPRLAITHRNRRAHDAAWVLTDAPSERRRDLDRLMRTVFQLSVRTYDEAPPEDATLVLELSLRDVGGDVLGQVQLKVSGEDAQRTYYASSESSGGWVSVVPSSGAAVTRALERIGASSSNEPSASSMSVE